MQLKPSVRSLLPVLVLAGLPPMAEAVDLEPSISIAEIYTNNVDLARDGLEESDWVTRVAPGISLIHDGGGLDVNLDYTFEALFYAEDSDRNEAYNQLDAMALLNLIGEELRLRAAANATQVNVEPSQPVSNTNINTTGNRSDALNWNVGPEWSRGLFGQSQFDGFARVGHVNYDDERSQDVDTFSGRAALHSAARSQAVTTYELAYEYSSLDYEISDKSVIQTAYLRLGYRVDRSTEVFVLGGLDNDLEDPTDDSLKEGRWEVGVATEFGAQRLSAALGERYFGTTYAFDWELTSGESSYGISYSEAPSVSDLMALEEIPVGAPVEPGVPPPDAGIDRPGDPTRYILKRADIDASWALSRSRLYLNLFWEDREDQVLVSDDVLLLDNLENSTSYGVEAGFSWEVGSRTEASISGTWASRDYNALLDPGCDVETDPSCEVINGDDTLMTLEGQIDYALGQRTRLGFTMGLQRRDDASTGLTDYDELWAMLQLARDF